MRTIITFLILVFSLPAMDTFAQATRWDTLYNYINDSLIIKQRYDEALTLSKQNLELAENTFGVSHVKYHQSSYQLGQILFFKKDYKNAASAISNSCKILETTAYKDSVYNGKALNLLGLLNRRLNDNDYAENTYLKAYKILKPLQKDFQREYTSCLNNLAVLYLEIGRTDEALDFTTQALTLTPKNTETYMARLGTLSLLYKRKGRFKEALYMAQEALNLTDKKNAQYPVRLVTLSALYADIGSFDKAFDLAKQALDVVEQQKGKTSSEYAIYANSLSILSLRQGRVEPALSYALEAQKIEETHKDKPEFYFYQTQVAHCYTYLNQTEKALPLLLESVEKLAVKPGKKSESYFYALGNLIRLYQKQGNIAQAIALNQEELDLVKIAWSDNEERYLTSLTRLIELLNANNQHAESIKHLKTLVEKLNNQVLYNVDVLDEYSKEQFIANFVKDYEPLVFSQIKNNAPQDKELLKMAYETELAMKGIILSSSQLFRQLANKNVERNALFKSWEKQKEAISKAYTRHAAQLSIDSLNTQLGLIEEKMIASMPDLKQIQRKTTSYDEVKKSLKPDACAIEFVRFRHHNNKQWTDSIYYAALIVKANQESPECVFLCEENHLKALLNRHQNAQQLYATRGRTRGKSRGTDTEGVDFLPSKNLYSLIWQPMQAHLKGIKTVYYTPSGILHQIAFSALPIDETNLLTDQVQLNALSSTRSLVQPKSSVKIDNAALYGGIFYDEKQGTPSDANGWQYLEGTKKEVNRIASLLTNESVKVHLNEGEQATENAFKTFNTEGVSPTVLHIATHGFFYQNKADSTNKSPISFQNAKNPLIRSGLVMAGANKAWLGGQAEEGKEDGILTAFEISNMNLTSTQVVVLSACETGLGDVQGSEGVYGLQRAFKMAGVNYILMSLWKVSDKHTAELMEKFYTFWLRGATIEDAFHEAQQAMRTKYLPYNWAGFVLMK